MRNGASRKMSESFTHTRSSSTLGKLDFGDSLILQRARRELGLFRARPIAALFSLRCPRPATLPPRK
jgi:hypothetical protein